MAIKSGTRSGRFFLNIEESKQNWEELCPLFEWLGFVPIGMMYHQARGAYEWRGCSKRFDPCPIDNLWPLYELRIDTSHPKPRYSVVRLEN